MKEIDIAATLEHVRDQRPGMVRTKVRVLLFVSSPEARLLDLRCFFSLFQDQFEFALTAVAEEVNAILKALPQ